MNPCGLGVVGYVIGRMACLECLTKYIIIYEVDRLRICSSASVAHHTCAW